MFALDFWDALWYISLAPLFVSWAWSSDIIGLRGFSAVYSGEKNHGILGSWDIFGYVKQNCLHLVILSSGFHCPSTCSHLFANMSFELCQCSKSVLYIFSLWLNVLAPVTWPCPDQFMIPQSLSNTQYEMVQWPMPPYVFLHWPCYFKNWYVWVFTWCPACGDTIWSHCYGSLARWFGYWIRNIVYVIIPFASSWVISPSLYPLQKFIHTQPTHNSCRV